LSLGYFNVHKPTPVSPISTSPYCVNYVIMTPLGMLP
jgi:hypothetical protein